MEKTSIGQGESKLGPLILGLIIVGAATTTKGWNRKGPAHPDFEASDVLPEVGRVTVEFIRQQKSDKPFFAYVPFTSPHTHPAIKRVASKKASLASTAISSCKPMR